VIYQSKLNSERMLYYLWVQMRWEL